MHWEPTLSTLLGLTAQAAAVPRRRELRCWWYTVAASRCCMNGKHSCSPDQLSSHAKRARAQHSVVLFAPVLTVKNMQSLLSQHSVADTSVVKRLHGLHSRHLATDRANLLARKGQSLCQLTCICIRELCLEGVNSSSGGSQAHVGGLQLLPGPLLPLCRCSCTRLGAVEASCETGLGCSPGLSIGAGRRLYATPTLPEEKDEYAARRESSAARDCCKPPLAVADTQRGGRGGKRDESDRVFQENKQRDLVSSHH